jgi:hypothetical protein
LSRPINVFRLAPLSDADQVSTGAASILNAFRTELAAYARSYMKFAISWSLTRGSTTANYIE